jgi:hypothetical protein
MDNIEERQNFISVDKKIAIDSFGNRFSVGDEVSHESAPSESAIIERFEIDEVSEEVKAFTSKGWAHIDFLWKPEQAEYAGTMHISDYEDEARRFLAKAHRCNPLDITHKAVASHLASRLSAIEQQHTCAKSYVNTHEFMHAMSEIGQILTCTDNETD